MQSVILELDGQTLRPGQTSLQMLTTSAAPQALAVAAAVLSHENTDHARRFESIAAEFAAAAGFAAGFAAPGRHSERP